MPEVYLSRTCALSEGSVQLLNSKLNIFAYDYMVEQLAEMCYFIICMISYFVLCACITYTVNNIGYNFCRHASVKPLTINLLNTIDQLLELSIDSVMRPNIQ